MNEASSSQKNSQSAKVFLEGEGDAYFVRNHKMDSVNQKISYEDTSFVLRVLGPNAQEMKRVLEVGSSDGRKLEAICDELGAEGFGIEPSSIAVETGNERFSRQKKPLSLLQGTGRELPFEDGEFDLVVLGFFLYVEDRASLLFTLAEADRVLRPGGFLSVLDFVSEVPTRRTYAHAENLFTYKNDYSKFFTSLSHYVEAGCLPISGDGSIGFDLDANGRQSVTVLWKKANPYP